MKYHQILKPYQKKHILNISMTCLQRTWIMPKSNLKQISNIFTIHPKDEAVNNRARQDMFPPCAQNTSTFRTLGVFAGYDESSG